MKSASATTTPAIISLGSNLGDRRRNLGEAIRRLSGVVRVVRISSLYQTEGIGTPAGSPSFLNLVVLVLARQSPEALLREMKQIERSLGRRRTVRNLPRVIDLDLILFGTRVVRSKALRLPHPRYRERNFVLEPLRELGLDWTDPEVGKRISSLRGKGRVERLSLSAAAGESARQNRLAD